MTKNREPGKYTLRVAYRVDPETREMMAKIAERTGETQSEVFRRLVRQEAAQPAAVTPRDPVDLVNPEDLPW